MTKNLSDNMLSLRIPIEVVRRIDRDRKQRQTRSEYIRVAIDEKLERGESE